MKIITDQMKLVGSQKKISKNRIISMKAGIKRRENEEIN